MFTLTKRLFLVALLAPLLLAVVTPPQTAHAETIKCADGTLRDVPESDSMNPGALCGDIGVEPGATVQSGSTTSPTPSSSAASSAPISFGPRPATKDTCGGNDNKVDIGFDIGCRGLGNPIVDALFAVIRVASIGVGIAAVAALIVAGLQYTTSRGDPGATAKAIARIRNTVVALLLYIFSYALLNYLVPSGLLQ